MLISGNFIKVKGAFTGPIVQYDGSQFSDFHLIDTLIRREGWSISSIAEYKGEIYVAGNINVHDKPQYNEIAKWDGQHWVPVGPKGIVGNGLAGVNQLLVWHGDLYICGEFTERDGGPGNAITRWDGHSFHRLAGGLTRPNESAQAVEMTVYHDRLYVVGWITQADSVPFGNGNSGIACWDGSKWCVIRDSLGSNKELTDRIGTFGDDMYVAGGFANIGGDTTIHFVAKWVGGDYVDSCSVPLAAYAPKPSSAGPVIYPNAVRAMLSIDNLAKAAIAELYDVQGRCVLRQTVAVPAAKIDMQTLPPGRYLLRINTDAGIQYTHIVIRE